jgi:hypothetical protein
VANPVINRGFIFLTDTELGFGQTILDPLPDGGENSRFGGGSNWEKNQRSKKEKGKNIFFDRHINRLRLAKNKYHVKI